MIHRGPSRTKKFYDCCFSWFVPHVHLHQDGGEVTWYVPFNLSKGGCQPCGCFYPNEVISQDGGKPHDCYLKHLFS